MGNGTARGDCSACEYLFFSIDIEEKGVRKRLEDILCDPGTKGSCTGGTLQSPVLERDFVFHGDDLRKATQEINAVLNRLKANPPAADRDLSLLRLPGGMMLAWMRQGAKPPAGSDQVTVDSPEHVIRDAFGLPPDGSQTSY